MFTKEKFTVENFKKNWHYITIGLLTTLLLIFTSFSLFAISQGTRIRFQDNRLSVVANKNNQIYGPDGKMINEVKSDLDNTTVEKNKTQEELAKTNTNLKETQKNLETTKEELNKNVLDNTEKTKTIEKLNTDLGNVQKTKEEIEKEKNQLAATTSQLSSKNNNLQGQNSNLQGQLNKTSSELSSQKQTTNDVALELILSATRTCVAANGNTKSNYVCREPKLGAVDCVSFGVPVMYEARCSLPEIGALVLCESTGNSAGIKSLNCNLVK